MVRRYKYVILLFLYIPLSLYAEEDEYTGKVFDLSFYDSLSTNEINIKDMDNSFILIHFWYSECPPCEKSIPVLSDLYKKYGPEKIEFIGISLDEDKDVFVQYCKSHQVLWPQYYDNIEDWEHSLAVKWHANTVPLYLLLNREKSIIYYTRNVLDLNQTLSSAIEGNTL